MRKGKMALTAAVTGVLFSSAAFAATFQGRVTLPDGSPVAGITVGQIDPDGIGPQTAVTDANGDYVIQANDQLGNNAIVFYDATGARWTSPYRYSEDVGSFNLDKTVMRLYPGQTITDTFSRTGQLVGSTSDTGQTWGDAGWGGNGTLGSTDGSMATIVGDSVGLANINVGDFDMTVNIQMSTSGWNGIHFKQQQTASLGFGEGFWFNPGTGEIFWSGADMVDGFDVEAPGILLGQVAAGALTDMNEIRMRVIGGHKTMWINGLQVIDTMEQTSGADNRAPDWTVNANHEETPYYADLAQLLPSGVGLSKTGSISVWSQGTAYVDDISITPLNVPEPGAIGLLSLAGLAGLRRRRA
jgi:hypothetical protein